MARGDYADAKGKLLAAINADPHNIQAFAAIMQIEAIGEILAARTWYGEARPQHHAVCLLGSLAANGAAPYTHHAYVGMTAYENYQMAHYLRDLMRWQKHPRLLQSHFILLYLAAAAMENTSSLSDSAFLKSLTY